MRKIDKIVVHVTDSDDSLDIGFAEINDWHKERGWLSDSGISCGYHYIIRRDGRIERGRPDMEMGAHVKGHNSNSIGIVWVGRNQISREQYESLKKLCKEIMSRYNLDIEKLHGHNELYHLKSCPNISMLKLRGDLLFTKRDEELKSIVG